jgi:hydrogenase 3 maturation protease
VPSLPDLLRSRLAGARRIAVLAVGSPLRGDDAAGLLAARELQRLLDARPKAAVDCAVFVGETAPESFTGEIRRFRPTHVVILDAADFGGAPGEAALIDPEAIRGNPSLSTHNLPMSLLTKYLAAELGCAVMIVGIQPARSRFGDPVSEAVAAGARNLARLLLACAGGGV